MKGAELPALMSFTVVEGKIVAIDAIDAIADPERVRRIAVAVLGDEVRRG